MNSFKSLWNYLIGSPREFSMECRTYHAASIISLNVLLGFTIVNFILGLWPVLFLALSCFFLQWGFYYIARFKNYFKSAVVGSAMLTYLSLIINYVVNSGINGPTLFIFFFTFNLLIIVAPGRLRYLWVLLHTLIVAGLFYTEYNYPDVVRYSYTSLEWRIFDNYLTYLIALAFLYYVSIYLRNNYHYERKLAESRFTSLHETTKLVASQETDIRVKNDALVKIAFIQSHELRAPVSSILGLMNILKEADFNESKECILLLEKAVHDLDTKIRLIVKQTEEFKSGS